MIFSDPFDENSPRIYRIGSVHLFDELNAVEIGYNQTPRGLRQVMKRDCYIVHYVVDGRGEFCGERFGKNGGYVVVPGELETVVADKDEPYEAYWIMFKGSGARRFLKSCGLPLHNGVFAFSKARDCAEILKEALFSNESSNEWEEAAMMNAALHRVMALHLSELEATASSETVAERAMKFINENYYNNITIEHIADRFNYSRAYLYTLFKQEYGMSPQTYLLNLRVEKAKELLLHERHLLIGEVALAVGYGDALYFSRVFRKRVGVSPKEFVKRHP